MLNECRNGSIKERFKWFDRSYIIDYAVIGLVVIGFAIANFAFDPYIRYLPIDDPEFSYPNLKDEVPTWALLPINIIFPIIVFLLYFVYARDFHDLHHSILGLVEALILTLFFTAVFKIFAGEYRPNYFAYSVVSPKDARQSFPSGHSSMSFCCQFYVSLYFAGKSKLFTIHGGQMWKVIISFIPLFAAGLIAVSRTRDYHHNFADISAGAVLGATIAYYCYHLNYPNLTAKNCYKPKFRNNLSNEEFKPVLTSNDNLDGISEAKQ